MANQRAKNIVVVSFTMPQTMAALLEQRAAMELTNRSDVVRRAVMAYLSPDERASILKSFGKSKGAGKQ
jgi:metal-responsive CopG/Arc/MetJ family transcriptional regulator